MKIVYTASFDRERKRLPRDIQELLKQQIERFLYDFKDARLHIKKLRGTEVAVYSLRVTRNYRVLFYWEDKETPVWFEIDHRKDVYR